MAVHSKLRRLATREGGADSVYGGLWKAGNRAGGGMGFWGSSALYAQPNPKEYVKAFIDGALDGGLSPTDAVLYGDWTDGRHLADQIRSSTTEHFRARVRESVRSRGVAYIHTENATYLERDDVRFALHSAGLMSIAQVYRKKASSAPSSESGLRSE